MGNSYFNVIPGMYICTIWLLQGTAVNFLRGYTPSSGLCLATTILYLRENPRLRMSYPLHFSV